MITNGLDHLNLTVKNLSESIEFYQEIFDFSLVEKGLSGGVDFAILRVRSSMLCLYEFAARTFLGPRELKNAQIHGLNHLALSVTDEDEFLRRLKLSKIEIKYGGVVKYPHSSAYYIDDPTGYEIEVVVWNEGQIRFGA